MVQTKLVAFASSLLLLSACAGTVQWSRVPMDGSRTGVRAAEGDNVPQALGKFDAGVYSAPNGKVFNCGSTPAVAKLMLDAQAPMAPLREVVAYAPVAIPKGRPESPLSNLTVDILMAQTAAATGRKVDAGIMNFGGIRLDAIPAGNVLLDDFVSMFPFKNHLCLVQLRGADLRKLFEQMAASGMQVVGGVRLVVADGRLESAEVGGAPLDDAREYGVATIDFLLDGGDDLFVARNATDLVITKIKVIDAMMNYVRAETAAGRPLTYQADGRVVIRK